MRRPARPWSFRTGVHGSSVIVYERRPGGRLYGRCWDHGRWRRVSLKHRDRKRAEQWAIDQAAKLVTGSAEITAPRVTWATLFALYETHRSPRKGPREQKADKRRIELWGRVLGTDANPLDLSCEQWEGFDDARTAGAIDARGKPVPDKQRQPVRARVIELDCKWLRGVCRWATGWRRDGRYLLREDPTRGFAISHEENPRRPVATTDRYEAIRKVSDQVLMDVRLGGKRRRVRSYLSEVLDIVAGTGRRVGAVRQLRFEDLRLERTKQAPHGAIQWPGQTDKMGKAWSAPITAAVRAALDRIVSERPGIGTAYLFPRPGDPSRPIRQETASEWLREAEQLAKLPTQDGSLWHAYRRAWATSRKHLPDVDVAAAGGWKGTETLRRCYQQPDDATILTVVLGGAVLREAAQ